jgi:C1A family cysteine protease
MATVYSSIADNDLNHMKACLAEGYPFVFGFSVYTFMESEEMARHGILKMPSFDDKQLGGHAVMAVGYDDATSMIIVRNSWGVHWGLSGYFMMPYEYITHKGLAADFWTIRATNG